MNTYQGSTESLETIPHTKSQKNLKTTDASTSPPEMRKSKSILSIAPKTKDKELSFEQKLNALTSQVSNKYENILVPTYEK